MNLSYIFNMVLKVGALSGLLSLFWNIYKEITESPKIEISFYEKVNHYFLKEYPAVLHFIVPLRVSHSGKKTVIEETKLKLEKGEDSTFVRVKRNRIAGSIKTSHYFDKDFETIPVDGTITRSLRFQGEVFANVPGNLNCILTVTYKSGKKLKSTVVKFESNLQKGEPIIYQEY